MSAWAMRDLISEMFGEMWAFKWSLEHLDELLAEVNEKYGIASNNLKLPEKEKG